MRHHHIYVNNVSDTIRICHTGVGTENIQHIWNFIVYNCKGPLDESPRYALVHAMRRSLPNLLGLAERLEIKRLLYLAPSAPALARDLAEAPRWVLRELHLLDQMPGTAQLMSGALLTLA